MNTYFQATVRCEKMQEDGTQKMVSENYLVDALSVSEAEARIIEEIAKYTNGEMEVSNVKKNKTYVEVLLSDDTEADEFFKATLEFIILDEKTQAEKRKKGSYLVQACNLKDAEQRMDEYMRSGMMDYEWYGCVKSNIIEVFRYTPAKTEEE